MYMKRPQKRVIFIIKVSFDLGLEERITVDRRKSLCRNIKFRGTDMFGKPQKFIDVGIV